MNRPRSFLALPCLLLLILACNQFGLPAGATTTPTSPATAVATAGAAATGTQAPAAPPSRTATAAAPTVATPAARPEDGPLSQLPRATTTLFWTPLQGETTNEIGGSGDFQLTSAVVDDSGTLYLLSRQEHIFAHHFNGAEGDDAPFATGTDFSDIALGPAGTLYAVSRLSPVVTVFAGDGTISQTINLQNGDVPLLAAPRRRLLAVPTATDLFVADVPAPDSDQAVRLYHFDHQGRFLGATAPLPLFIGGRGLVNDPAGHLYLLPGIGPILARFDQNGAPAGQLRVNLPDGVGLCAVAAANNSTLFLVTSSPHGVLRLGPNGRIVDFLNLEEALPVALDWPGQQRCLVQGIAATADGNTVYVTLFPSRWERAIDHVIGFRYD